MENVPKIKLSKNIFNDILNGKRDFDKRYTAKFNIWDSHYYTFEHIKRGTFEPIKLQNKFDVILICKEDKNKMIRGKIIDIIKISENNKERIYNMKFNVI